MDPSKRKLWCASSASTPLGAPLATIGEGENDIGLAPGALPTDEGRGAIELAVLGACACPGCSPCRCAQAAARLKRQVARSREEAVAACQRAEDAYVVVDAYRNAFEEQLTRNRALTLRVGAAVTAGPGGARGGRMRELVRWVGRQLHELGSPAESRRFEAAPAPEPGCLARSLSTSSWSMCESVLSGGHGPNEEEEEGGGGGVLAELEPEPPTRERPPSGTAALLAAARDLSDEQLLTLLLEKVRACSA